MLVVAALPQDMQAFKQGLPDAGYIEGRDVVLDWRSAQGDYARVPLMVDELIRTRPDVIVVETTPVAQAVKRATAVIPIVMATAGDPARTGLVGSLARPGGNLTGLSLMTVELEAKRVELLKEMIPTLRRLGVMWDPSIAWHQNAVAELEPIARAQGIALTAVQVQKEEDFEAAFSVFRNAGVQAVNVLDDAFYFVHNATVVRLAQTTKVPVMYPAKESVWDGGLISYSADITDMFRRAARYVDKILKGAKPSDLPVEQPTKFELVVNLKTAKPLGIPVPASILVRADEVVR